MADLIVPLFNMSCPTPTELDQNSTIHGRAEHLQRIVDEARKRYLVRTPWDPEHFLVITNADVSGNIRSSAGVIADEMILGLRLYKAGGVYYNFLLVVNPPASGESTSDDVHGLRALALYYYNVYDHKGIPYVYELTPDDMKPLRDVLGLTRSRQLLEKRCFRNFFQAYHEPLTSDRFLKNAVALENILVNDGGFSNISYKFVDRGCYVLQRVAPHSGGAAGHAGRLKEIYKARSGLVHSRKNDPDWSSTESQEMLADSETYVRQLLVLTLQDPRFEKSEFIDEEKRKGYL